MSRARVRHIRGLALAATLTAFLVVATSQNAPAEKPGHVVSGNGEVIFGAGFFPTVVSKTKPTPVALSLSWGIATSAGFHPPSLSTVTFKLDGNAAIDLQGYPACNPSLPYQGPHGPEQRCRHARIGSGTIAASIALPEAEELRLSRRLLIFNGGRGKLYAYSHMDVPVPSAIVITGQVKRIHEGGYRTEVVFSVPRIAGGLGSLTSFSATIGRRYTDEARQAGIVTLRCPGGKLVIHGDAFFIDETQISEKVARTCRGT
jgi:hypothetical protein